jgi:hypothetical protein
MSDQPGTLELVALELGRALGRVADRLSDRRVLVTFAELGVQFPPELLSDANFNAARGSLVTASERLSSQVGDLESSIAEGEGGQILGAALTLASSIGQLVTSLEQLVGALQSAGPGLPGITTQQIDELVADLPTRLLDLLLYDKLTLVPSVGAVLEVFGVIECVFQAGDPANPTKPDFDQITLHLDRLLPAVTNPIAHLRSLYQWGQAGFDATALLGVLESALAGLGLPVRLLAATPTSPTTLEVLAIDLRPTSSGSPPGLEVDFVQSVAIDRAFTFPVSPPAWQASVSAHAAILASAGGTLRPPLALELTPPSGELNADVSVALSAQPPTPLILLGEAGGSRLELASVTLGGGAQLSWDGTKASGGPSAQGAITGGKLVIDASQGDGFITTLLGGGRIESDFALQFAFAPETGVRFEGSGSLELQLPVHVSVGAIDVESLYLVAGVAGSQLPIELSAALSAELGPLTAAVERLGAIVTLGFPAGGGNVGPAQIDVAFKPPTGVGLSLQAGIVTGGGFLYIDTARGEYAGALQLEIAEFLGVSAIGLISTKNPDGSPGFSLLIVITADFGPGIQLGFGFTLNAVGGLLGLHRTVLSERLLEGVRSDAIEGIMFPHDVIANAPRIISDLRAIFPPQPGTFLIGPMAKLGWGEPTLVSLSLGVIVEIPPGDIAILGVLKVVLPTQDAEVLRLQVNFAGALEFSKSRLYFFASLYDSHLLFITIQGEMGLLVAWGKDANLLISAGGFHPCFTPPPLPFPAPQRIQIDIVNESYARIRCEGYFAVTTNTIQFGAHTEMFFGFPALSVEGHADLDALIQRSPFHFIVEISTSFSVKVFGVGVWGLGIDLTLEGSTPWHAQGSGTISLLFFSIDVPIDFTFGDARNTTLPPVAVMPILAGELGKRSNWKAQLPSGSNLLVSLRKLDPAEADLVLHPVGTLQVSQGAVPLDLTLDKFGSQKPSDANRFRLSVTSAGMSKVRDLQQPFAPAQFMQTDDATKLSEPAFSPQDSGVELAPAGQVYASATAITRVVRHHLTILDATLAPKRQRFFLYPGALFQHWLKGASVTRSGLSAYRDELTHPYAGSVAVAPETYAVAHQADNTLLHPAAATFTSRAAAMDHLAGAVAADPSLAGTLHVLPQFEVVA